MKLTLLIICRGNHFNTNHVNSTEISTFVGAELIDFVRGMIQNTKQMFGIDLESEEFISRFCVHLHNLLIRNTNNLLNSNPLKTVLSCNVHSFMKWLSIWQIRFRSITTFI